MIFSEMKLDTAETCHKMITSAFKSKSTEVQLGATAIVQMLFKDARGLGFGDERERSFKRCGISKSTTPPQSLFAIHSLFLELFRSTLVQVLSSWCFHGSLSR
jgi:hypothetical protein